MTYKLILSVLLVLALGSAVANETHAEGRYQINGREVTAKQWSERPYVPPIPRSAFRDKEQVSVESTPPLREEGKQHAKGDRKLNAALVIIACLVAVSSVLGLLAFRKK